MPSYNGRRLFQIPALMVLPLAIVGCSDDPSPTSDTNGPTTDVGPDAGAESDVGVDAQSDDDAEGADAGNPSDSGQDVPEDTLVDVDAGSAPDSDDAYDAGPDEGAETDTYVDVVDDTGDSNDAGEPEPGSYLDRLVDAVTPILTTYCEEYVACTGTGTVADCVEDLLAEFIEDDVIVWTPDCLDAAITYASCYFTDPVCTTNDEGEPVLYPGDYCTPESYLIDEACEYTDDYSGYDDYKR